MMFPSILVLLTFILSSSALSTDNGNWTQVKDIRLDLKLRIVNEGVAHVDNSWIFSNKGVLFKTTVDPVIIQVTNKQAISSELRTMSYDHIGDIDAIDGIIYGGLEAKDGAVMSALIAWNGTDLSMVRYKVTNVTHHMPWVAIDPASRLIYSAIWNAENEFQVYDLETFEWVGVLKTATTLPGEIQGGAFYEGFLYLACNGADNVFRVDVVTGLIELVLSDAYDRNIYPAYEMEGLDFWDLRSRGLGMMHLFGNFMEFKEKSIHNYDPPS